MTLFFDLILLAIVVLLVLHGMKTGLIHAAFRPKRIYSFIIAFAAYKPFGNWICGKYVEPFVRNKIEESVLEATGGSAANAEALTSSIPDFIYDIARLCNIDINAIANDAVAGAENATIEFISNITMGVAGFLSAIAGGIVLYFISRIVLVIAELIISLIFKAKILDRVNKIGGAAFGGLSAYLFGVLAAYALGYGGAALAAGGVALFSGFAIENTVLIRVFLWLSPLNLFI